MFVGYFRFELEGSPRIVYFRLLEGHQFYSVWLFSSVAKVTDRNDPAYVVDKPQLRYVPEVLLECFRTYAIDSTLLVGQFMSFIVLILWMSLSFFDMV